VKQQHLPFFQPPTGDRPFLAMGLLLIGVFTLALQDATVKLIAPETSFWQFQTIRAVGNAFFIVPRSAVTMACLCRKTGGQSIFALLCLASACFAFFLVRLI
jgi:hypothetical protein